MDLAVVGAGIVGASVARCAARAGLSVVLLDKGDLGGAVSAASLACIGTHMILPEEVPLLVHCCRIWAGLEAETDCDIEHRRCGQLRFVLDPVDLPVASAWLEQERAHGLPRSLLDPKEVREIEPLLTGPIVAASWSPDASTVNPFLAVRACIRDARRHGARILPRTPVTAVEMRAGSVVGVRTPSETIPSAAVVVAAGPWAAGLLTPLGVDLPIVPRKAQCLATTRQPAGTIRTVVANCETSVGVQAGYTQIQQAASGQILFNTVLGGAAMTPGSPDAPAPVDETFVASSVDMLVRLFPALADKTLLRSWVGYESVCPDDRFAVGQVGPGGLFVASGCNGIGFTRAPAIGEIVTDLVLQRTPRPEARLYDPLRLAA
ncbi:MAG: FAD-dependent oxidoreductase [Geminicoccaceae bacterium]